VFAQANRQQGAIIISLLHPAEKELK